MREHLRSTPPTPADLLRLPAVPASARAARRYVRQALHGAAPELVAVAELVTSELITNAVLHTGQPCHLRVLGVPDGVRIEVGDGLPGAPAPVDATPDDDHGRGLQLVDALADDWGCRSTADGKVVWAEMGR